MKHTLLSLFPFFVGFLVWLAAGAEAALVWFMAYYLLLSLQLLLLKRQRKARPPILADTVFRVIGLDQDDRKE
jgi:hypothetical protein